MKKYFCINIALLVLLLCVNITAQDQTAVSSDGVKINYHVEGSGEPALVFIHGWSCDNTVWVEQVKTFSPKYKVVTIDLAGHGKSGIERKDYTLQLFGADVAAVVNQLGLTKVVLIGHSMGGPVVIEAANLLKGKVIGLIGADTFQNLGQTIPAEQIGPFLKPFRDNFVITTKAFVKMMFPPTADSVLVKKVAEKMSSAPPAIALSAIENMYKDNAIKATKELLAPIISINCDLYPVQLEQNKKVVKFFEMKLMKGVGHFVMLENPATFDKLLQEAVNELVTLK
jgi:pimeloyl-ACP methyl ester carboxylesterase